MKPRTTKMMIAAAAIAAVILIAVILRWTSVPKYEITDLGYIKGQGYAAAMNNEGQVVGWTHALDPNARPAAFIWSQRKGRRTIPALEGKESRAYDINDKGQVVGYLAELTNEVVPARAFIWDKETGVTELGTLGNTSQALAVNNRGQVVGASRTTEGQWHAFIWDERNGMRDLGTLGGKSSRANDINDKGQVVGYADLPNGQKHAFIWQEDTGMVDLGTIKGLNSGASGINNTGLVIGDAWEKNISRPFVWDQARGMTELRLPGDTSYLVEINDSGQAVGFYSKPSFLIFGERKSLFLWQSQRRTVDLDHLLGRDNTALIGADINDKGRIVVTIRKTQQNQMLLLTPKPKSEPPDK